MKTLTTGVNGKTILASLLFALSTCLFTTPNLQAQTAYFISNTTAKQSVSNKEIKGLHVQAQAIDNTTKVKLTFENNTDREIMLLVRNDIEQVIFSKLYPHTPSFKGMLNLSALGDGDYTLQVSTLMKAGFVKQSYKQPFQIQSHTRRSIAPAQQLATGQELITLEAY